MKPGPVTPIAVALSLAACLPASSRLEIETVGTGTTTPAAGTYLYPTGTTVEVTAHPGAGAAFKNWSGASSATTSRIDVLVEGDLSLVAHFAANGTSSGGTSSGGSSSGGTSSGGTSSGGTSSGGTSSGGTSSGGTSSGGTSSGGTSSGGTSSGGSSGGPATVTAPCDLYAAGNTPCVAAHSTVRALYGTYGGNLYQVRRASDRTTRDVPVLAAGGFASASAQETFCAGTTCTISIIYDQSPNGNHLKVSPWAFWLPNGGKEANAAAARIMVGGHAVYGVHVDAWSSVAYRNNATTGIAKGDEPEAMYMVVDGKSYSKDCCFDYGNAETNGRDNGNGTMEALYFGTDTTWGGKGDGNGPWLAADLENGMFKRDAGGWQTTITAPNAKSIIASFVTGMLKGPSGNRFVLKGGDAQSGTLTTTWDGSRPSPGYSPKKLEGAIILGTGGDGSNGGAGTFFEGCMTRGVPSDATDEAVQANIVAAGYGR